MILANCEQAGPILLEADAFRTTSCLAGLAGFAGSQLAPDLGAGLGGRTWAPSRAQKRPEFR